MTLEGTTGLRLLSLDGGSIRGLSQLVIIDALMNRIQAELKLDAPPRPCEYFNMIVGTGMGGINALLLGRLRMTAREAIDAYIRLTSCVFTETGRKEGRPLFKATRFSTEFSAIVTRAGYSATERMKESNESTTLCKTFVCAMSSEDPGQCYRFRSYQSLSQKLDGCTIVDVARATTASSILFKPIQIGSVEFVNGWFGCSNPVKELMQEARNHYGSTVVVDCIISLGTGKGEIQRLPDTDANIRINGLIALLSKVSTDCETAHVDFSTRVQASAIYHRFNVQCGGEKLSLKEWLHIGQLISQCGVYLRDDPTPQRLDRVVRDIVYCPIDKGLTLAEINAPLKLINMTPSQAITRNFVGREDLLISLFRRHFSARKPDSAGPVTTILSGVAGSGKSQLALMFAAEYERRFPNQPVYVVDSSSKEQLEADLRVLLRSQGSEYREASHKDALSWLTSRKTPWLLILNNVGEALLDLISFLPRGKEGSIIVTTDVPKHSALPLHAWYSVSALNCDDATKLLLQSSNYSLIEGNRQIAHSIIAELGCLTISISHAAGFISLHRCLGGYLERFRQSRAILQSQRIGRALDDRTLTAYATIHTSFHSLSDQQQDLLRLFSCLYYQSISHNFLMKAVESHFHHHPLKIGRNKSKDFEARVDGLMQIFFNPGNWSEHDFDKVIRTIQRYNLLQLTITSDNCMYYSIHKIVQEYIWLQVGHEQLDEYRSLAIRLLSAAIQIGKDYEYLSSNQQIVPHLRAILKHSSPCKFEAPSWAIVLFEAGDYERCTDLALTALEELQYNVSNEHNTIIRLHNLLEASMKRLPQPTSVVEDSTPPNENDTDVLAAMETHYSKYWQIEHFDEAAALAKTLSRVQISTPSDDSDITQNSNASLGDTTTKEAEMEQAVHLEVGMIEAYQRSHGPEHPETLKIMNRLGRVYIDQGEFDLAEDLLSQVLDIRERKLGNQHPDTLRTMGNLATIYTRQGRHDLAAEVGSVVVETRKRVLGDDHPSTLLAIWNQATVCAALGDDTMAEALYKEALVGNERILGFLHPRTCQNRRSLEQFYLRKRRKLISRSRSRLRYSMI